MKNETTLHVQNGVQMPATVNADAVRRLRQKKRALLSVEAYVAGILSGNRSLLGRAITLIESTLSAHQAIAEQVVSACLPHAGASLRLGITGVPGVGKSTFIEALGKQLIGQGRRLAVLAIDPSSARSKGSILGDKTRMDKLAVSPHVFIRPSPAGSSLGGVAAKTRESIILCEAAGFDTIFIETVGVGQSETLVSSMVDFFLLLMLSGAGDELQGIKRGIMEMADSIAITKADGENSKQAQVAAQQYKNALHLFPMPQSGFLPQVLPCSALSGKNIPQLWQLVEKYVAQTQKTGFFQRKRKQQAKYWLYDTINSRLQHKFYENESLKSELKQLEHQVLQQEISPFLAAKKILGSFGL